MHSITTRPANSEEQKLISRRAKSNAASYGCMSILFGLFPVFIFGKLGGWLGGYVSAEATVYGQWMGWLLAVVLFVYVTAWFVPHQRRIRQRAAQDKAEHFVQEIHVVDPRVIDATLFVDADTALAIDIGEGKILYLQGEWLRDNETYGADALEGDPFEEFVNGFPEPYSFPSSEFTISRLPHSGEVIGIRVAGKYVAPDTDDDVTYPEIIEHPGFPEFGESELFEGSLDDIANVMVREHERRFRTSIQDG